MWVQLMHDSQTTDYKSDIQSSHPFKFGFKVVVKVKVLFLTNI